MWNDHFLNPCSLRTRGAVFEPTTIMVASLAASAIAIATAAPAPAAPAAPAGGGLQILDFKPAFDDLMTMLVQPRHTKLWLAAQQKNWQLAGFELNEMGGALKRVGQTVPKYRNISVDATVSSIFTPKIQAVAGAITAQNPTQFNTAYAELTNLQQRLKSLLDNQPVSSKLDAYSRAHLQESAARIAKILDARFELPVR